MNKIYNILNCIQYIDRTDWIKQASHLPKQQEIKQIEEKESLRLSGPTSKVTEASPFAKLFKTHKKDERSKQALIRMLWHDKKTYLEDEKIRDSEFGGGNINNVASDLHKESQSTDRKDELEMKFQEAFEANLEHKIDILFQDISDQFDKEIAAQTDNQSKEDVKNKFVVLNEKIKNLQKQLADKINNT